MLRNFFISIITLLTALTLCFVCTIVAFHGSVLSIAAFILLACAICSTYDRYC